MPPTKVRKYTNKKFDTTFTRSLWNFQHRCFKVKKKQKQTKVPLMEALIETRGSRAYITHLNKYHYLCWDHPINLAGWFQLVQMFKIGSYFILGFLC